MPQETETAQAQIQGQFSTAEVTHVLEALKLEGSCYLKNHFLMQISNDNVKPIIREWHDNVTRRNLDALTKVAKEMGVNLPFPKKLEERENEIKKGLQNAGGEMTKLLMDGEILTEIKNSGEMLDHFYSTSMYLATHDKVRECFRGGRETVADNFHRVEQGLRETKNYYPPPIAHEIGYVAEQGVKPQ